MNKYAQFHSDLIVKPKQIHYPSKVRNRLVFLSISLCFFIILSIILIGIIVYYKKSNHLLSTQLNELKSSSLTPAESKKGSNERGESLIQETDLTFIKSLFFNSKVELKSLYRAIIDGDSLQEFRNRLNGVSSLLFVIETTTGLKIGGYMSRICDVIYHQGTVYEYDLESFVFSLKEKSVYKVENPLIARHCNKDYLIAFNTDLMIRDNCLEMNGSSSFPANYNNPLKNAKKNQLTNGVAVFKIKDLEVFKVNKVN